VSIEKEETFVQFVCFLATLSFKIFHIAPAHIMTSKDKNRGFKYICNILFMFLESCSNEYKYFPLRALTEYFAGEQTEQALSKRLNSESLLQYKNEKHVFTCDRMLIDILASNSNQVKGINQRGQN